MEKTRSALALGLLMFLEILLSAEGLLTIVIFLCLVGIALAGAVMVCPNTEGGYVVHVYINDKMREEAEKIVKEEEAR